MQKREEQKYVIKVFEAQWDEHHDSSVKPFFEQLKRETSEIEGQYSNHRKRRGVGHDALYKYRVFQTAEGLKVNVTEKDSGVGQRKKNCLFCVPRKKRSSMCHK